MLQVQMAWLIDGHLNGATDEKASIFFGLSHGFQTKPHIAPLYMQLSMPWGMGVIMSDSVVIHGSLRCILARFGFKQRNLFHEKMFQLPPLFSRASVCMCIWTCSTSCRVFRLIRSYFHLSRRPWLPKILQRRRRCYRPVPPSTHYDL